MSVGQLKMGGCSFQFCREEISEARVDETVVQTQPEKKNVIKVCCQVQKQLILFDAHHGDSI